MKAKLSSQIWKNDVTITYQRLVKTAQQKPHLWKVNDQFFFS